MWHYVRAKLRITKNGTKQKQHIRISRQWQQNTRGSLKKTERSGKGRKKRAKGTTKTRMLL